MQKKHLLIKEIKFRRLQRIIEIFLHCLLDACIFQIFYFFNNFKNFVEINIISLTRILQTKSWKSKFFDAAASRFLGILKIKT